MLLFSLKDAEKGVPIPILRKEVVIVLILIVSASHGHITAEPLFLNTIAVVNNSLLFKPIKEEPLYRQNMMC